MSILSRKIEYVLVVMFLVSICGSGYAQGNVGDSSMRSKDGSRGKQKSILINSADSIKKEQNRISGKVRKSVPSKSSIQSMVPEFETDSLSKKLLRESKNHSVKLKKDIANEKKQLKGKANDVFEGDGLTNENATDKIKGLLNEEKLSASKVKDNAGELANGANAKDALGKSVGQVLTGKDSLLSSLNLDDPLSTVKKIYSEKRLNFAYDSLLQNVDWNVLNAMLRDPSSVSDQALLEAVFVKFPGLKQVSKTKQDAAMLSMMANGTDPLRTLSSLAAVHLHDLSSMKVSDSSLSQLPPLRGTKLDTKYLKYKDIYLGKLDSLRKVNLKGEGLKLTEKNLSDESKETRMTKRFGFLRKFYVEGIVGILNGALTGNMNLLQLSPSLGCHLVKNFSIGAGPNVILEMQKKKVQAVVGLRTFAKYEFFKYNSYLQIEDNLSFPRVNKTTLENKNTETQHAFLAGCGYLLPLSRKLSFNLSVLYRFAGNANPLFSGSSGSPWVYRIGISSTPMRKKL